MLCSSSQRVKPTDSINLAIFAVKVTLLLRIRLMFPILKKALGNVVLLNPI